MKHIEVEQKKSGATHEPEKSSAHAPSKEQLERKAKEAIEAKEATSHVPKKDFSEKSKDMPPVNPNSPPNRPPDSSAPPMKSKAT